MGSRATTSSAPATAAIWSLGGEGDDIILGEDGSDNELFGFFVVRQRRGVRDRSFKRGVSTADPGTIASTAGPGNNDLYGESRATTSW